MSTDLPERVWQGRDEKTEYIQFQLTINVNVNGMLQKYLSHRILLVRVSRG